MDKSLFHILEIVASQEAYKALTPAIVAIEAGAPPDSRLTLKVKLIATVAGGLTRIVAALLVSKVHDCLDAGAKSTDELEEIGCKMVAGLSPEVLLFAALSIHFFESGDKQDPFKKAHALLKTLGHEIPEELIPGVHA